MRTTNTRLGSDGSDAGDGRVLLVGSLAAATRTIAGNLGQAEFLRIDERRTREIVTGVGLPARAVDEPDFIISTEQQLLICAEQLAARPAGASLEATAFAMVDYIDATLLGLTGLAMLHAPSFVEFLRVCTDFPQLVWGQSRIVATAGETATTVDYSFDSDLPDELPDAVADDVRRYCVIVDLAAFYKIFKQSMGPQAEVLAIEFPFAEPDDADRMRATVDCDVRFGAEHSRLLLPPDAPELVPLRANPMVHRGELRVCAELARLRPESTRATDHVKRWLWAYVPPLPRDELARRLGTSSRSLSRRLGVEGTSYNRLLADVQRERATNLLRNPALTVAEIGYRLGYSDPAAFTRAFVGWTGVPPSTWRVGPDARPS